MRKQVLLIIALAVLAPVAFILVKSVRSQGTRVPDDRSEVEAVRRGGLKEAARIKGNYVTSVRTSYWLKYDLESLAKNSADIVVGTPIDGEARLSPDGQTITTEHHFKILESLKGNLSSGETIVVSLPGGKIVFEDGTSAEVITPDLEGMVNSKSYALFLSPRTTASGAFSLTGAGQGLFELNNEKQSVKPRGHPVDPVQKHKGENVEVFLEEIRSAVRKYPNVSSCCY